VQPLRGLHLLFELTPIGSEELFLSAWTGGTSAPRKATPNQMAVGASVVRQTDQQ